MAAKNQNSVYGTWFVLGLFLCVFIFSAWKIQNQPTDEAGPQATSKGPTAEQMASMRSQRGSSQSNGWRQLKLPSVPAGIDVFRSGKMDIFRSRMGPFNFHIKSIDTDNFGVTYTDREDPDGKNYFASLRFCRRLSFMGNPNVDQLLEDLKSLPAVPPLSDGAVICDKPQSDAGFDFSDIRFVEDQKGNRLIGNVTNSGNARVEAASFYVVVIDPNEQSALLSQHAIAAKGLLPNVAQPFEVHVPKFEVSEPMVKIWLEFTAPRRVNPTSRKDSRPTESETGS